jgi:osmotically-inducible protein OsmY
MPDPDVKEHNPQIGSGGGDMFLFTQVRSALSSDKELFNTVIVEIKEGNATISGNVKSEAQKAKAAQLVQSVNGIKSVKNNLRVTS